MSSHHIDQFIALETAIAQALIDGNHQTDANHLTDDFLGVYESGFAGKEDHSGQLDNGPTLASYEISDARLITLAEDTVLLSYRATFTRAKTGAEQQQMYVTSIWQQRDNRWLNIFSQDTPVKA